MVVISPYSRFRASSFGFLRDCRNLIAKNVRASIDVLISLAAVTRLFISSIFSTTAGDFLLVSILFAMPVALETRFLIFI